VGKWIKDSEYCLSSDPNGWTIAKCYVNEIPQYVLWQGDVRKGQFDSARDAMREHTRLTQASAEAPGDRGQSGNTGSR
jgi:hypothetical protein